jgi:hypothetical protein
LIIIFDLHIQAWNKIQRRSLSRIDLCCSAPAKTAGAGIASQNSRTFHALKLTAARSGLPLRAQKIIFAAGLDQ